MYKVFIIVHRSWGWTLGGQSLSFSKWHGLWKPWWPMNSGVFLFLSVLFTSYYANFQTTWSREDSAMNPQLPIIRTQRLSRFCHVCFVYPLLNISFFFCWNILRQIQLLHHSTPASSSMHWLKKKKKETEIFLRRHNASTTPDKMNLDSLGSSGLSPGFPHGPQTVFFIVVLFELGARPEEYFSLGCCFINLFSRTTLK